MRTFGAVLVLSLTLIGCNSPTSPTPPTTSPPPAPVPPLPPPSSIVSMSVLGSQWIATTSAPVQMTARIFTRIGDAPTEYVDTTDQVAWSLDPAGVASIDRQGRLAPITSGAVNVIATLGERTARLPVRVLPEYSGTWSGVYVVTGCSGAQDFRTCPRLMFGEGGTGNRLQYPFSLTLGQDRDLVTGTLREPVPSGGRETAVSGFVRLNGSLVLEASVPQPGLEPFQITNWSSAVNANATQLSGGFTKIAPYIAFGGGKMTMRTEHEFVAATRVP